jgi:hypothetical protein
MTPVERAALARAEAAEADVAKLRAVVASYESDVRRLTEAGAVASEERRVLVEQRDRLQRELGIANACLASVRHQRRNWRDLAKLSVAVVSAARLTDEMNALPCMFSLDEREAARIKLRDAIFALDAVKPLAVTDSDDDAPQSTQSQSNAVK